MEFRIEWNSLEHVSLPPNDEINDDHSIDLETPDYCMVTKIDWHHHENGYDV